MAKQCARIDGIEERVSAIAASGGALPFGDATFSATSHSDVLCCMPEKMEILDECRRVSTDRSRMLFLEIAVAEGLPAADRMKVLETGPPRLHRQEQIAVIDAGLMVREIYLAAANWPGKLQPAVIQP